MIENIQEEMCKQINDRKALRNTMIRSAIESIAARMVALTADSPDKFIITNDHLEYTGAFGGMPARQGRNFAIYESMAQKHGAAFALTDFAGVILRFWELFPEHFPAIMQEVKGLSRLMEYPDEAQGWESIWE